MTGTWTGGQGLLSLLPHHLPPHPVWLFEFGSSHVACDFTVPVCVACLPSSLPSYHYCGICCWLDIPFLPTTTTIYFLPPPPHPTCLHVCSSCWLVILVLPPFPWLNLPAPGVFPRSPTPPHLPITVCSPYHPTYPPFLTSTIWRLLLLFILRWFVDSLPHTLPFCLPLPF